MKRRVLALILLFGCGDVGILRIVKPTFEEVVVVPTVLPTEAENVTTFPNETENVTVLPTATEAEVSGSTVTYEENPEPTEIPSPEPSPTPTEPTFVLTPIRINEQTFQVYSRQCFQNQDGSYSVYLMADYGDEKDLLIYLFVPNETHGGTHYDNLYTGIQVQDRYEEINYMPDRYVSSMIGSCVWSFNRTARSGSIACEFFLVNSDPRDYFGNEVTLHTVNFTCD